MEPARGKSRAPQWLFWLVVALGIWTIVLLVIIWATNHTSMPLAPPNPT
jgi:hypothetical protein